MKIVSFSYSTTSLVIFGVEFHILTKLSKHYPFVGSSEGNITLFNAVNQKAENFWK